MPHPSDAFCGCVLDASNNGWQSVGADFQLPYLSAPAGGFGGGTQSASLSAWVAVEGQQFLQTTLGFLYQVGVGPLFSPEWQWWSQDPADPSVTNLYAPGSGELYPAPPMSPGDMVGLTVAYYYEGTSGWGLVSYIFFDDVTGLETIEVGTKVNVIRRPGIPTLYNILSPAPQDAQLQASEADWVIENASITDNIPNLVLPVFSASPSSITPVSFTNALAWENIFVLSGPGNPINGTPWIWVQNGQQLCDLTLGNESVSVLYTA
jgi:hypothetical protein